MILTKRVCPAFLVLVALTTLACHRPAIAIPTTAASNDPPGRVARLSYLKGPVSFQAAGTESWVAAALNRPLTTGDSIWCDDGAVAELHLGPAAIRLGAHTAVTILELSDQAAQVKLSEGTLALRVRRLEDDDSFEIATPHAAFSALRTGDYRLDVPAHGGQTRLIVRSGQMDVSAPRQNFVVRPRQQARLPGPESAPYEISPAPTLDSFDDFCAGRDRREENKEAQKYVSHSVVGWEDLDDHGTWHVHAVHGPLWAPRVIPPGWAPYRFGHWVWIEPWGWTWVDDAPWGFAPSHYGRWIFLDRGWCWTPGPVRIRAVYAPALVVFVGGGGRGLRHWFSLQMGVGVAWFPLGPREVYVPPFRASRTYVTNINVSNTIIRNTTNLHQINVERQHYVNRTVRGSITAAPEEVFRSGRPVGRGHVAVSPREAAEARVGGMTPPVVPNTRSVAPAPEGGRPAARPPERATRQSVVVRRTPPPQPVPFEQRQRAHESDPGRPADQRTLDDLRRGQPQQRPDYRQVLPPSTQREEAPAPAVRDERTSRQQERRKHEVDRERSRIEKQPPSQRQRAEPKRHSGEQRAPRETQRRRP